MRLLLGGEHASPWRRVAAVALVLGVIVVHGCVTQGVLERMGDLGRSEAMPQRMEVAYVREMELSAPPVAAPAAPVEPTAAVAPPKKKPKPKPKPPKAASAPELAASEPATVVAEVASAAASAASAPDEPLPAV
ncbi:MAG TPA: hypothetical protein VIO33_19920, partial [Burkholderiaceae bacterium]